MKRQTIFFKRQLGRRILREWFAERRCYDLDAWPPSRALFRAHNQASVRWQGYGHVVRPWKGR